MTKVHSAPFPLELENLRNVLEVEGIASEVRTPFLGAARGDIPATECWSELWVIDDAQVDRAMRLIQTSRQGMSEAEAGPPWVCGRCGEENEQQFDACWRCGAVRMA